MSTVQIFLDVALIAVATVALMLLIGAFARRLLGTRVSAPRVILAGVAGLGGALGFESRFVWRADEYTPAMIPILFGIILLVAITVLVVAEFLVPQGTVARPDRWLPNLREALDRNRRTGEILRIATRHRLLPFKIETGRTAKAHAQRFAQARSVRLALEEAGGAFVKLGQLLSTRPDVVPEEYIAALADLQQRVPPAPWPDIAPALDQVLAAAGTDRAGAFSAFDEEPFAAASIGQVYRATLADGSPVAVKIRRPGIVPLIERDTDIATRFARRLESSGGWAAQMGVERLVTSLSESLSDEVHYAIEAANLLAMAGAQHQLSADARVRIPRLHEALSSDDVLTMEFVSGTTLSDGAALTRIPEAQREALAQRLLRSTLAQIMDAGVFHADLHPGNIVVTAEGELALLDFGSIGRLDSTTRARLADVLLAFSRRDAAGFADALLEFVEIPDDLDEPLLRREIADFMARRLGPGARIDAAVFTEIVAVLSRHGLTPPPELTVPFRALASVEGSLRVLAPEFDLVAEAAQYAERRLASAARPTSVAKALTDEFFSVLPLVRRLPHRVDRITGNLADGRLSMNVRMLADKRDRGFLRDLVNLAALTFLAGVFGIMAAMLLVSASGPRLTETLTLFQVFGYLLLIVSGVLTLRALFDPLRRRGGRER